MWHITEIINYNPSLQYRTVQHNTGRILLSYILSARKLPRRPGGYREEKLIQSHGVAQNLCRSAARKGHLSSEVKYRSAVNNVLGAVAGTHYSI